MRERSRAYLTRPGPRGMMMPGFARRRTCGGAHEPATRGKGDMASQICPQCHQEAPGTAKFCPNCASPLRPEVTPPPIPQPVGLPETGGTTRTPTRLDSAAWGSQRILIIVLVVGLLVIASIAAYSLHQNSVLQAERNNLPAPPLVGGQTPNVAAPSVVGGQKTPLPNGPSVVAAQGNTPTPVPPAVLDYLNFLGKIEDQRVSLKNNVNGALAML